MKCGARFQGKGSPCLGLGDNVMYDHYFQRFSPNFDVKIWIVFLVFLKTSAIKIAKVVHFFGEKISNS
jgi:hypothetical protein